MIDDKEQDVLVPLVVTRWDFLLTNFLLIKKKNIKYSSNVKKEWYLQPKHNGKSQKNEKACKSSNKIFTGTVIIAWFRGSLLVQ
jgi:hypothetical protein